jgi:hypothetical protein
VRGSERKIGHPISVSHSAGSSVSRKARRYFSRSGHLEASEPANDLRLGDLLLGVVAVAVFRGQTIVRGRYDGEYDKTNLPDELILTNYFTARDGKIVSLTVIRNTPAY